jgi:hypothetical protein
MVKYIHLALDDKTHARWVEIKGDSTWIEFLEVQIDKLDKEENQRI